MFLVIVRICLNSFSHCVNKILFELTYTTAQSDKSWRTQTNARQKLARCLKMQTHNSNNFVMLIQLHLSTCVNCEWDSVCATFHVELQRSPASTNFVVLCCVESSIFTYFNWWPLTHLDQSETMLSLIDLNFFARMSSDYNLSFSCCSVFGFAEVQDWPFG